MPWRTGGPLRNVSCIFSDARREEVLFRFEARDWSQFCEEILTSYCKCWSHDVLRHIEILQLQENHHGALDPDDVASQREV